MSNTERAFAELFIIGCLTILIPCGTVLGWWMERRRTR